MAKRQKLDETVELADVTSDRSGRFVTVVGRLEFVRTLPAWDAQRPFASLVVRADPAAAAARPGEPPPLVGVIPIGWPLRAHRCVGRRVRLAGRVVAADRGGPVAFLESAREPELLEPSPAPPPPAPSAAPSAAPVALRGELVGVSRAKVGACVGAVRLADGAAENGAVPARCVRALPPPLRGRGVALLFQDDDREPAWTALAWTPFLRPGLALACAGLKRRALRRRARAPRDAREHAATLAEAPPPPEAPAERALAAEAAAAAARAPGDAPPPPPRRRRRRAPPPPPARARAPSCVTGRVTKAYGRGLYRFEQSDPAPAPRARLRAARPRPRCCS